LTFPDPSFPITNFAYDVANYTDIDPLFGTTGDFDPLVEAAHARGLRILLDLVAQPHIGPPTHGSDIADRLAQIQAGLVHLEGSGQEWQAAEQLAVRIRRQRLDIR